MNCFLPSTAILCISSSDGLAGLGGLDIYKTYAVHGFWKTPVNIGYPLNSSFDDFGIIFNTNVRKDFFNEQTV